MASEQGSTMQVSDRPGHEWVTADRVDAAVVRVGQVAVRTPLEFSGRLSKATGARVWLKREDLQPVRSYKVRGAFNFMAQLDAAARGRGVVCASAGNHAQGVALSCRRLGVVGRVFVPRGTPGQKQERIRSLGGDRVELVVSGESYDEAAAAAEQDARTRGATLVPAFDDAEVICGQGTVAREIVEQLASATGGQCPDLVVVPVGGGGLVAGMAAWMRERSPATRVVGVEPAGAASMTAALVAGRPVRLAAVSPLVDGAAVGEVGALAYEVVRDAGLEMLAVMEGHVCTEVLRLHDSDGIIAEPAGALASASLTANLEVEPGATVVCVVSGGNNDVRRYGEFLERSLVHRGLKHYFRLRVPPELGALQAYVTDVLGPDVDVTLLKYERRSDCDRSSALVGVELTRPDHLPALLARLEASPVAAHRVTPTDRPPG